MARSVGIETIVQRAQRRCDKESDRHVGTAEWKALISEMYAELHGMAVEADPRYFEVEQTITANGGAGYALPADYLSTIGVDYVYDSAGRRRSLDAGMVQERNDLAGIVGEASRYFVVLGVLVLAPKPASGSYRHVYVAQPTDYSNALAPTVIDCLCVAGEQFIVWGAASIAQHKSDESQQRAISEREAARERFVWWAANRELVNAKHRTGGMSDADADPAGWWPRR